MLPLNKGCNLRERFQTMGRTHYMWLGTPFVEAI